MSLLKSTGAFAARNFFAPEVAKLPWSPRITLTLAHVRLRNILFLSRS